MSRKPRLFDLDNPNHWEELASAFLPREGGVVAGVLQMQAGTMRSADSGARWEGDVRGLRGYDTSGNVVFNLDTQTGSLTLTGAVTAGGTTTGATLQTASSGKRVVIAGSPGDRIDFYSGSADESSNGYILVAVTGSGGSTAGVATWVTPAINSQDRASISLTSESKDGSTSKMVVALSADTVLGVATTTSADTSLQWQGDIALFDSVSDPPVGAASYVRVFNSGGTGLRATSSAETAPLWPIRVLSGQASASLPLSTTITDVAGATVTFTTRVPNAVAHITAAFYFVGTTVGYGACLGYCDVDGTAKNEQAVFISGTAGEGGTEAQTWEHTFATPGSHTVKLRAAKSAAGGAAQATITHTCFAMILVG